MKPLKSLLNSLLLATALITSSVGGAQAWTVDRVDQVTCGTAQNFTDGTRVSFLAREGGFAMGVMTPRNDLKPGNTYKIAMLFDGAHIFNGEGRAIDKNTLLVVGLTEDFVMASARYNSVRIQIGGVEVANVSLKGSLDALLGLMECVKTLQKKQTPGFDV